MRPEDARYSETHEWVRANDKKKEASIGITDYAVKQLSDLVHLELTPKVGDSIEPGAPFGEIESVKTVADLVAPIGGQVIAVNEDLVENVDTLKTDAFDDGWMIKVKYSESKDLDELMTAKEYKEFLDSLEEEKEEENEKVDDDDFM
ncbi:MAG: glycine cleavage system protein GcvH [Planctomycetes bacterium]|nr:glycine cleavage system protein GcvH [Planctomycetota bacterium]